MTPYQYDDKRVTYFAATHTRGKHRAFGIRAIDRAKHVYVIGKTGMGKSTLLENMAIQDIQNGEGMTFVDPHGSTAEKLLDFVPEERIKDVLYFAPFDTDYPVGFNVMEDVGYDKRHLVVSGLMGTFKRIWVDTWSARMEYILSNTLLALLEYPDSTLLDVNRMLINKAFRQDVIEYISDPIVKSFWSDEFASYTDTYTREATPAIQNKIGQFTSNPLIRNIVGQPRSSFDVREMMDKRKLLIINLSKGRLGEVNASLLGSMLTVKIYLAAMSRADVPPPEMKKLPPFYFYVDEFQSVVNDAFADILSEARKYKLALTIAHQYIEQMDENVRAAVFGNIGTFITFRVGPFDAEVLKTVFEPTFHPEDLVNLDKFQIYLSLMIDGAGSQPFSAVTLPPIEDLPASFKKRIIEESRQRYARSRSAVEEAVFKRQQTFGGTQNMQAGKQQGNNASRNNGAGSGNFRRIEARPDRPPQNTNSARTYIDRPSAPPAPRAPADVLRKRVQQQEERNQKSTPQEEKKGDAPRAWKKEREKKEEKGRSALRDAITAAVGTARDKEKGESPSPAPLPKKKHEDNKNISPTTKSQTPEDSTDNVPPEVLSKLLRPD